MKIALLGYGTMGRAVEKIASEVGHCIVARLNSSDWNDEELNEADVCIEFTNPQSAVNNIKRAAELNKNIIIGTTGWYEHLPLVERLVHQNKIGALYSPNFSIGIYLFLKILSKASQLINSHDEYDVAGIEYHHAKKKDAPSGTALSIAKTIEANIDRIETVPFSSVRCGSIPGIHSILFDSPHDTITITHEARDRDGFASGSVQAAEWIINKKGLYTFTDFMENKI